MDKIDREKKALRRLALRDQFIEEFKCHKKDLKRINKHGPKSEKDVIIIEKCVNFVVNELKQHMAEFKEYQEEKYNDDLL